MHRLINIFTILQLTVHFSYKLNVWRLSLLWCFYVVSFERKTLRRLNGMGCSLTSKRLNYTRFVLRRKKRIKNTQISPVINFTSCKLVKLQRNNENSNLKKNFWYGVRSYFDNDVDFILNINLNILKSLAHSSIASSFILVNI